MSYQNGLFLVSQESIFHFEVEILYLSASSPAQTSFPDLLHSVKLKPSQHSNYNDLYCDGYETYRFAIPLCLEMGTPSTEHAIPSYLGCVKFKYCQSLSLSWLPPIYVFYLPCFFVILYLFNSGDPLESLLKLKPMSHKFCSLSHPMI